MLKVLIGLITVGLLLGGCGNGGPSIIIEEIIVPDVAVIDSHYLMDASVNNEDINVEWIAEDGEFTDGGAYDGNKVEWRAPSSPGVATVKVKANDTIEEKEIEVVRPPVIAIDYDVYTEAGVRMGDVTFQNNSGKDIKGMELIIIGWNDFNERIPTSLIIEDFRDYQMNATASDINFPVGTERTYTWYIGLSFINNPSEIQAYVTRIAYDDGTTWELGKDPGLDDNRIEGRVVINGNSPQKRVTVSLRNYTSGKEIETKTNEQGFYAFDSVYYSTGDDLEIVTGSVNDFSEGEIEDYNLVTWTGFSPLTGEDGVKELPDLDLYRYSFSLTDPEPGDEVSLPHEVVINHYDRNIEDRFYWMYFYDYSNNYLGESKEAFTENTFIFSGELSDGSMLETDAFWYVACGFTIEDYVGFVNIWGHGVGLDTLGVDTLKFDLKGDLKGLP